MNVVDSSMWLEYFADGPAAKQIAPVIRDHQKLIVPAVCLYEVFKVILRAADENSALQAYAAMQKGMVVDLTPKLAIAAAKLSIFHRLPMADSIILATAHALGATVWTQDAHFQNLPGVNYFPKAK